MQSRSSLIQRLAEDLKNSQFQETTHFMNNTIFAHRRGLWESEVHINFVGGTIETLLRQYLGCVDNNMFASAFIVEILLEAQRIGGLQQSDLSDNIEHSLEAFVNFTNKNPGPNGNVDASQKVFWLQKLNKKGEWYAAPENLDGSLAIGTAVGSFLHKLLDSFGLDWLWKLISPLFDFKDFLAAFHIPSDTDDSSANVAIGAQLKSLVPYWSKAQGLYNVWSSVNARTPSLLSQGIVKYSYSPFLEKPTSGFPPANPLLDPRTYYFGHKYFETLEQKARSAGRDPRTVRLLTTWLMNQDMENKLWSLNYSMPENVNNVDVSVATNTVYSLIIAIVYDVDSPEQWFDSETQMLFNDTIDYIWWALSTGRLRERRDIGVLYYPPITNVYWFASRILHVLGSLSEKQLDTLPGATVLRHCRDSMASALRGTVTQSLLLHSNITTTKDGADQRYWCSFLGQADPSTNEKPHPDPDGEDCVYSTAVAINALINTWSVEISPSGPAGNVTLQWFGATPRRVKTAIQQGMAFVASQVILDDTPQSTNAEKVQEGFPQSVEEAAGRLSLQCPGVDKTGAVVECISKMLAPNGKPSFAGLGSVLRALWRQPQGEAALLSPTPQSRLANAFFSGSVKGESSLWFFYPANTMYFLNGTKFPAHPTLEDVTAYSVIGVNGVMDPKEYEKQTKSNAFGLAAPDFHGFNGNGSAAESPNFPYWTSPSITRAFALLAASKCDALAVDL